MHISKVRSHLGGWFLPRHYRPPVQEKQINPRCRGIKDNEYPVNSVVLIHEDVPALRILCPTGHECRVVRTGSFLLIGDTDALIFGWDVKTTCKSS